MDRNEFIKNLKKTAKGAVFGATAMASVVGCGKTNEKPQTELQVQTEKSVEEKNAEIEARNRTLQEYNKDLDELKNEIRAGNADELDFENKMMRGIQILTAVKNGFDIGVEEDISHSIIPERSANGGLVVGYKLPENLKNVLKEGAYGNEEEYSKAVILSRGELNYEAADIYNEYVGDIVQTDNRKVEAIDSMKEQISRCIKPKERDLDR